MCTRFNVQQYPTFYMVEGNGEVCNYEGDRMPGSMMTFLEERRRGEGSLQCRALGRISFWSKILGYLDPIVELLNYNTAVSHNGCSCSYWPSSSAPSYSDSSSLATSSRRSSRLKLSSRRKIDHLISHIHKQSIYISSRFLPAIFYSGEAWVYFGTAMSLGEGIIFKNEEVALLAEAAAAVSLRPFQQQRQSARQAPLSQQLPQQISSSQRQHVRTRLTQHLPHTLRQSPQIGPSRTISSLYLDLAGQDPPPQT